MPGARHQFAPAVTIEQAIDGAVIHVMSDVALKGLPDLCRCRDLASLSPGKVWGQELLFFFQRQILIPMASLARRLHGRHTQPVVRRDHGMHRCFGDPAVPGNLLSLPRFHQRIINDQPPLPAPGARIRFQLALYFFNRQMAAEHVTLVILFLTLFLLFGDNTPLILSQSAD